MTGIDEFNKLLENHEDSCLEFKTAKDRFNKSKDLPDYCAALSNEGGGKLILGVDDSRRVVGTQAFKGAYNKLSHEILQKLKIRVDVEELKHPDGRVLIIHIPSRPCGQPIRSTGKYTYPMRAGESLVEMDNMTLRRILNETEPDFSGEIAVGLGLNDLDEEAIENFKKRWAQKARRDDYLQFSNEKLLTSLGLLTGKGLKYAALILFGKKENIDELLPGSEIIFEWRNDEKKIAYDFRKSWREPFFKICDEIWDVLNARNTRIPFQDGLFQREVYAFSEKPIREAILNAIAHRDYTINKASIFIKASPEKFSIESPGGFPYGVTLENVLEVSCWRNRCIAETLEKAGLVERSGQGMDDIFRSTITEGKGMPDLSKSDSFSVRLKIPAQVKDKKFILFLEKVIKEKQITLSFEEIYELEKIREQQVVSNIEYKKKFLNSGIIEKIGKTSGSKYIISHKYYEYEGKVGVHTRLTGLMRDQKKTLILNNLRKNKSGSPSRVFRDAFPDLKRSDINNLLQELKKDGKIKHIGPKQSGKWIIKGDS